MKIIQQRGMWAGLGLWILLMLTTSAAEPKRVLLLHSLGREFAPFSVFSEHFRTELAQQSPVAVDFFDVPLASARSDQSAGDDPMLDYLHSLFAGHSPDLVVPVGGPAVRFAQRNRSRLFPASPMLLASTDALAVQAETLTTNDAVVVVNIELPMVLENILHVQPATTNVVVVMGNSPLEKFWVSQAYRVFTPYTNRVGFMWFNELSYPEMLRRAGSLPPHSAILYGVMCVDADGVPHEEERALTRLHQVANAPMFGVFDFQFGRGIVGGPLISIADLSHNTAAVAVRLLQGESPASLRPPPQKADSAVFDWRELRRWGIHEADLPAGSTVRLRQSTFWELYRWRVLGVAAVFLLQTALSVALLVSRANCRQEEEARREADEKFRLAVEGSPNGVILVDQAGHMVLVNSQVERMFGYERAELLGQTVEMLLPARMRGVHAGHVTGFFMAPKRRAMGTGCELLGCRKDETEFPIEIGLSPIQSAQGTFVLTAIVDISARRQAETALLEQREELAHVTRVATLGELTSSIAHELNQPLGAILRNAEAGELILQEAKPDLEEIRAILADIRADEHRAGDVIDRVRALLKRRDVVRGPLNLEQLTNEVVALLRPDAELRRVRLTVALAAGLPVVLGDRVRLQQVLLNLLLNAMDAVHENLPANRLVTLRARPTGAAVEISVSDNGPGIPADKLPRLFTPFFTSKPNGLGMGLVISQSIIQEHGGQLSGHNELAGGATFTVVLPVEKP